jgi:hypothetical protein
MIAGRSIMSYPSTLACLVVGFLAAALVTTSLQGQPEPVFCMTDQGGCAAQSNWNFYALSVQP